MDTARDTVLTVISLDACFLDEEAPFFKVSVWVLLVGLDFFKTNPVFTISPACTRSEKEYET